MRVDHEAGTAGPAAGFLALPSEVYADDPLWIPEEPHRVAWAFSDDNPWFESGEAQTFCVRDKVRLAVFRPNDACVNGVPAAFFGYFETTGDSTANKAAVAQAEEWAIAHGAQILYGPINFSTALGYRLMLSREPGGLPFPGEPYNPASYPAALEELGFSLVERYMSQGGPAEELWLTRDRRRQVAQRVFERGRYRVEGFTPDMWQSHLPALYPIIDEIFRDNFAYMPMPYSTFERLFGGDAVRRLCPVSSVLVFAPDDSIVGLCVMQPHYGPITNQAAGDSRVQVSALNYEAHVPALQRHHAVGWLLKTIGLSPGHRSRGLLEAMVVAALDRAEGNFNYFFAMLMRAGSTSRKVAVSHSRERWYGLYAKQLGVRH